MRSDARLVKGVVRRDPEALAELYDRYSATAYSILLRIAADPATAAQLFEDWFRQLPKQIGEYHMTCHCLEAWIILTARNFGIDHIRSLRVTAKREGFEAADERRILEMAFFEGSSLNELAEGLKTPSRLMEARLRAALQSVKGGLKAPVQ